MTYEEADRRFGSDKPDLRFGSSSRTRPRSLAVRFGVFAERGGRPVPARAAGAYARRAGEARGGRRRSGEPRGSRISLYDESGEVRSPIAKFLSEEESTVFRGEPALDRAFRRRHVGHDITRAWCTPAPSRPRARTDRRRLSSPSSGSTTSRCSSATRRSGAGQRSTTRSRGPAKEWEGRFAEDPEHALAHAYDLIVNGNELGGGSFRIHVPEIQGKVFELLGMSEEEQRSKFGFLLDALAMGAPPMGGIALGIDRITGPRRRAQPARRDCLSQEPGRSRPDVGAPSEVTEEQLIELGIRRIEPPI